MAALLSSMAIAQEPATAYAQLPAEAPDPERQELTSLRTERSKTFLEADGSRTGRFFTGPVHFRAADGTWQEIDTKLVPSSRPGYAWRNAAGAFTAHFAATARPEGMVVVTDAASSVAFGLAGADPSSTAVVDESRITYPAIKPGIDLVYELRNGELKELIVLHRAPVAPLVLDFPLALENLTAQEVGGGALDLVTASGDVGFRVSDVWMVDSAQPESGEPAFSEDLISVLTGTVGSQALRVVPSHLWLTAPERVYPVTIDPTTTKTTNDDTYVQSNIFNTDVSGENEMKSGTYDGGATKARSLMKFADVQNQVPSGASITGAKLFVYEFHSWSCTPRNVSVHRITEPWNASSVRWSNQPGVAAAATTVSAAKGYSSSCSAGWVTFDSLGSMVQYWRANNNNYGMEIRSPNETDSDWWKKWRPLGSGNAPYLEVYYTNPDTTPPGAPSVSSSSHPSESTWYNTSSPSFNWTTPSDTSGIEGYSVKLDQVSNTFPDNAIDVYGNSTSYGAQASGEWWFHVRAKDGAGNWSEYPNAGHRKIRIDALAPSTPVASSSTHPSQTAWSASDDPCLSWSSSDAHSGVAGYSYVLTTNPGATPDTWVDTSGTSTCFTDYPDGTWHFRIHAKDNAGNWSGVGSYTVKIDQDPATPSVASSTHASPDTWYASQNPGFNWSATDESGIAGYSYQLTTSATTTPDTTPEGAGTSTTYSSLADGEWWFHVRAQNGVGVWGDAAHRRVRIDSSPSGAPSLASSTHPSQSAWSTNNDPSFSFSTSDMSGIAGYSFTLDQSPATVPDSVVDSASGSTSYSDVGDGTWHFHVRAQNGSGLWSGTVHYQVNIDTVGPAVPTISSSTHPNEALTYSSNDPAFSWTASDDRSGIAGYSYELNQLATTTPDTTSEGLTSTKSYSSVADGVWWFHVRAKDQAGNWGAPDHYQVSIDVPAPSVSVTLTGPAGQTDQAGRQVVTDGDTVTFGGTITEGAATGAPLDPSASIVTCELSSLDADGTEVQRLAVPLSSCRNEGGSIQGSFTSTSLGTPRGTLHLEVIARRGVESSVRAFSPALQIDNDVPHVVEAALGCQDPSLGGVCVDERAVTVELSEWVKGDIRPTDFSVAGNTVLAAAHTCTQQVFCYRVTLTTASAPSLTTPPQVSYTAPTANLLTAPPEDAANHGVASFTTTSVNLNKSHANRDDIILGELDFDEPKVTLQPSPIGSIVPITVNAHQSCDAVDDPTCGSPEYRRALARRVKQLATKPPTETGGDGVGNVAPDLILLQESNCSQAEAIAKKLNGLIAVNVNGVTRDDPYKMDCLDNFDYRKDGNGDGDKKDLADPEFVADTPILFNRHTMEIALLNGAEDPGAAFVTRYSEAERKKGCERADGGNCQAKYKRNFVLSFVEIQGTGSKSIAVVNTHLANGGRLADDVPKDDVTTRWLTSITTKLEARYEHTVDLFAVAGDLNSSRCKGGTEKDQGSTCGNPTTQGPKTWWTTLTGAGYADAIYRTHSTDSAMNDQYKDGCTVINSDGTCDEQDFRPQRIDFIFAKAGVVSPTVPVLRASFDLTCGQNSPPPTTPSWLPNCKKPEPADPHLTNPDRYSDHRMQWAVLGVAPPPVGLP